MERVLAERMEAEDWRKRRNSLPHYVVVAADMALAGIESQIPVDQVIDAMKEVGDKMDVPSRSGTGARIFAVFLILPHPTGKSKARSCLEIGGMALHGRANTV